MREELKKCIFVVDRQFCRTDADADADVAAAAAAEIKIGAFEAVASIRSSEIVSVQNLSDVRSNRKPKNIVYFILFPSKQFELFLLMSADFEFSLILKIELIVPNRIVLASEPQREKTEVSNKKNQTMCSKNLYDGDVSNDVDVDAEVGDASSKVASTDFENESIRKTSNARFVASVGVVIFSMVFNGTVYGYTSPALLSMQHHNMVDRYPSNKYNDSNNVSNSREDISSNNSNAEFNYAVEILRNEP